MRQPESTCGPSSRISTDSAAKRNVLRLLTRPGGQASQRIVGAEAEKTRELVLGRLQEGERIGGIAAALNVPYGTVHAIATQAQIRYVGKHLDAQQRREITHRRMVLGESIRVIAARMNLPKSKIGRFTRSQYHAAINAGGTVVAPVELKEPKRCPTHGLVKLWPCVACAARARWK